MEIFVDAFVKIITVGLIFGIPFFAIFMGYRHKIAEKRIESTASHTAEKAAQYASRVQELEDRVRVLERIVTDRGYDVATQIEALRDQRETDERIAGMQMNFAQKENA